MAEKPKPPRDKRSPFSIGSRVHKRWTIQRKLGQGTFGAVYLVNDSTDGLNYAMKIESEQINQQTPFLQMEADVLVAASHRATRSRICGFVDYMKLKRQFSILIMELLGPNLHQLRMSRQHRRFSNSTATRVALECIEGIEELHTMGFVHRDVKAANFAIGRANVHRIFIIDFGLCRLYRHNGKIVPPSGRARFVGTPRYASINAHKYMELGPRDDVWSWLYTVIEFFGGVLPWCDVKNMRKILDMKCASNANTDELFRGIDEANALVAMVELISGWSYETIPNYEMLKNGMRNLVRMHGFGENSPFDWESASPHGDIVPAATEVPTSKEVRTSLSAVVQVNTGRSESDNTPTIRVILITGSADGIGKQAALELAKNPENFIIVHGPDETRCKNAISEIKSVSRIANEKIDFVVADFASMQAVKNMVAEVEMRFPKLNVIVCNEGVVLQDRRLSNDGLELTFQINHLAHFLLATKLRPLLKHNRPSRVIIVSSKCYDWYPIDWDDLTGQTKYDKYLQYSRSKMMNHLFGFALARRFTRDATVEKTSITANVLDTGVIETALIREGRYGDALLKNGAAPLIYLAQSKDVEGINGEYFNNSAKKIASSKDSRNEDFQEKLWRISEDICQKLRVW